MTQQIPLSRIVGWTGALPKPALVKSMKEEGFMDEYPVIVTPLEDGTYLVRDGRRRCAAAAKANVEAVKAIVTERGAELTIQAHSTSGENPIAELEAYQELQRQGYSDKDIAAMGYASLQRIRKVAKLNRLVPEIAARVEAGEVAYSVAEQIAGLDPSVQRAIAREPKITGSVVKKHKTVQREDAFDALSALLKQRPAEEPATAEEFFAALSGETLAAIAADIPPGTRFNTWRAMVQKAVSTKGIPVAVDAIVTTR